MNGLHHQDPSEKKQTFEKMSDLQPPLGGNVKSTLTQRIKSLPGLALSMGLAAFRGISNFFKSKNVQPPGSLVANPTRTKVDGLSKINFSKEDPKGLSLPIKKNAVPVPYPDFHKKIKDLLSSKADYQEVVKLLDNELIPINRTQYLKWLKANEPDTFAALYNLASEKSVKDLNPYLEHMTLDEVSDKFRDVSPDSNNFKLLVGEKEIFLSKDLLIAKFPYFESKLEFNSLSDTSSNIDRTFVIKGNVEPDLEEETLMDVKNVEPSRAEDEETMMGMNETLSAADGESLNGVKNETLLAEDEEILFKAFEAEILGTKFEVSGDNLFEYLSIANYFQLDNVQTGCETWIRNNYVDLNLTFDGNQAIQASPFLTQSFKNEIQKQLNTKALNLLINYSIYFNSKGLSRQYQNMSEMLMEELKEIAPFVTALEFPTKLYSVSNTQLSVLPMFTNLQRLNLSHGEVTDEGLEYVAKIPNLKSLNLSFDEITDTGLEKLQNLVSLEKLNLRGTSITDEGLASLANLQNLKWLNLSFTDAHGEGFANVDNMKSLTFLSIQPSEEGLSQISKFKALETLKMTYSKEVTPEGLIHLQELPVLSVLDLEGCKSFDDECVKQITNAPALKDLLIPGTSTTDNGLAYLPNTLESLTLSGTAVTDGGMEHLLNLEELQVLQLVNTSVTKTGLEVLKPLDLKIEGYFNSTFFLKRV